MSENKMNSFFGCTDLEWIMGGLGSLESHQQQYPSIQKQLQTAYSSFNDRQYSNALQIFEKLYQDNKNIITLLYASCLCAIGACSPKTKDIFTKFTAPNSVTHYLHGLLLDFENNAKQAMEEYMASIICDPDFAPSAFRLGYHFSIFFDDMEAIEMYEKVAQHCTHYGNVLINLGVLYEDVGKYSEAIACYQKILSKYPNHGRARLYLQDAEASMSMVVDEDKEREQDKQNQTMATPITDFELSVRSKNCLNKMKIRTLGDLVKKTEAELLAYKNFGETSLGEIKEILTKRGLKLGMGKEDEDSNKRHEKKIIKPTKSIENPALSNTSIATLELSVRCRHCLSALNIQTIGELVQKTEKELLSCKNFGQTSMNELKQKLFEFGIRLAEN